MQKQELKNPKNRLKVLIDLETSRSREDKAEQNEADKKIASEQSKTEDNEE